jgi:SPP1 family predicted phage head-tail adaptor
MALIIGRMRHRLALQSPTGTQSETGEVVNTYSTVTTVWGSLRPLTGREMETAAQISEEINYQAVIRYHSTIGPTWRITNDSKTYEVVSVLNFDEKDEYMILELKRIA